MLRTVLVESWQCNRLQQLTLYFARVFARKRTARPGSQEYVHSIICLRLLAVALTSMHINKCAGCAWVSHWLAKQALPPACVHADWTPSQFADTIKWRDEGLSKPKLREVCHTEGLAELEADDPQHWNRLDVSTTRIVCSMSSTFLDAMPHFCVSFLCKGT